LGLHLWDIDDGRSDAKTLELTMKFGYAGELVYPLSLASSKLAILCFYWRMFKTSNLRTPIRVIAGGVITWFLIRVCVQSMIKLRSIELTHSLTTQVIVGIFHCIPVRGYWDLSLEATCVNDAMFMFGTNIFHLLLDISILTLPVLEVKKLKISVYQKIAVSAMFLCGIL
jgi:hypothetical protein